MNRPILDAALDQLGRLYGVTLNADEAAISMNGREIPLPVRPSATRSSRWDQRDLRNAFPSRAQGDEREKLLYLVVQDASPNGRPPDRYDRELREKLPDLLPVGDMRDKRVLADAMREEYWVVPKDAPFLLPYHSTLPLAYRHDAQRRYRMFSGVILPFLCWTGSEADEELISSLLQVFNDVEGFSLLDDLMVDAAKKLAEDSPREAIASKLIEAAAEALVPLKDEGAFCQPGLDLFQQDLRTVLGMRLGRRDLIEVLTQVLSLHLAVHYYRVALVLSQDLDRTIAAAADQEVPPGGCDCRDGLSGCPLAPAIAFRVGTGGYRPVSLKDPCVTAHQDLDGRRLLALPVNIITANLAQHIWQELGGPRSKRPRLRELTAALRQDRKLRTAFNAAASAFAAVVLAEERPGASEAEVIREALRQPALYALREALLGTRRADLRHMSRDVVNQLVKRESGMIRSNGTRATFFELDESFLSLLVKLVCRDREIPLHTFTEGLRLYGLNPQHAAERDRLTETLERLGMLTRYSDAGESTYVRHPL